MSLELNWQLKIELLGGKFSNVTFSQKPHVELAWIEPIAPR